MAVTILTLSELNRMFSEDGTFSEDGDLIFCNNREITCRIQKKYYPLLKKSIIANDTITFNKIIQHLIKIHAMEESYTKNINNLLANFLKDKSIELMTDFLIQIPFFEYYHLILEALLELELFSNSNPGFKSRILPLTVWQKISLTKMTRAGNWEVCLLLVKMGRNPNEPDEQGFNCFDILTEIYYRNTLPPKGQEFFDICQRLENPKLHEKSAELIRDLIHPKTFQEVIARESAILEHQLNSYYAKAVLVSTHYHQKEQLGLHVSSAQEGVTRQHKSVLWSLSNIHRRKYFNTISLRKKREIPIVEDISLNFIDLTEDSSENAFRFVVHTTSSSASNIVSLTSDKNFIKETPFFSCSLIDRNTPAAEMSHQEKVIFDIRIILDLADDAVIKAFPCDAWSPMLTTLAADQRTKVATKYLDLIQEQTASFSKEETTFRACSVRPEGPKSTYLSTVDMQSIFNFLKKKNRFQVPTSNSIGNMPHFTPHHLLNVTEDPYNELIIAGKATNKIVGICVNEEHLKKFQENYLKFAKEEQEAAKLSLRTLTKLPYPLVLIRNNPNGQMNKKTTRKICEELLNRYTLAYAELQTQALKQCRLESLESRSEAVMFGYQKVMEKFKNSMLEAERLKKEAQQMLQEYYPK